MPPDPGEARLLLDLFPLSLQPSRPPSLPALGLLALAILYILFGIGLVARFDGRDVPVPDFTYINYAAAAQADSWDLVRRKVGAAAAWHATTKFGERSAACSACK